MSKISRRHTPQTSKPIVITAREFAEFQGICATYTLKAQGIQQQAAQQIAVAQQPRQQAFLRLVKKYRSVGMRPDVDYAFDEVSHALVALRTE